MENIVPFICGDNYEKIWKELQNLKELAEMENIVLVGRTGNGKSATGNSILGKHVFVSKAHATGVTMECESEIVQTPGGGPKLRVIDTPGLFDLTSSADYISKEIVRCLNLAEGGLHSVLLVLSVRNRVTKEEEVVLSTLAVLFGSKIINYVIVVFTGGDVLEEDGETMESYLDGCPVFLKRLLKSCEQRHVLFDNRTKDEGKKTKQVQELLNNIELVRKHADFKPYTEDMYNKIKEETDRHKKEQEELEEKKHMHADEEFEALRKELLLINEQNLKAMAEMMEKNIRLVTDAQEKFFAQTEKAEERHQQEMQDALRQMEINHRAEEDRHHAEEEKHQQEMEKRMDKREKDHQEEEEKHQKEMLDYLSQMDSNHCREMKEQMEKSGSACQIL